MRSRSTGSIFSPPYVYKEGNPGAVQTWTGFGGKIGTVRTMSDVITPRFKERSKKGDVLNNYMSWREESCTTSVSSANMLYPPSLISEFTGSWMCLSQLGDFFAPNHIDWSAMPPINMDRLKALAGTSALGNVAAADVESLVELAELKKTIDMLRHPLENAHAFLDKLERRRRYTASYANSSRMQRSGFKAPTSNAAALSQLLAAEWLRLRYGIMPVVYTAQGIMKALGEGINLRQTARGKASDTTQGTYTRSVTNAQYSAQAEYLLTQEVKVRCGVLYSNELGFASRWGVAPHSLTSAMWELVPYSFVVDWLANIGDYIKAITPKPGVKHLASWTTVETTSTAIRNLTSFHANGGWQVSSAPHGADSLIIKTYERSPGNLMPSLAIDTPSIKKILDGNKRTLDLLSLLIGRLDYRRLTRK